MFSFINNLTVADVSALLRKAGMFILGQAAALEELPEEKQKAVFILEFRSKIMGAIGGALGMYLFSLLMKFLGF